MFHVKHSPQHTSEVTDHTCSAFYSKFNGLMKLPNNIFYPSQRCLQALYQIRNKLFQVVSKLNDRQVAKTEGMGRREHIPLATINV